MAIHYLGDNNPDGMVLGLDATEKVGFYGKAPIVQPNVTAPATTATTATNELAIVRLEAALVALGLIVTN